LTKLLYIVKIMGVNVAKKVFKK